MLVLTRKVGEEIVIGDNIRVTVVELKGGKVRLGVSAPPEIAVDRDEVRERRMRFFNDEPVIVEPWGCR
jgi:carbon storage regulator